MQAMKQWYQSHPHLFNKRPYDRPGCDTYPRPEDRSWWKPFEVGVVGMVRDDPIKHQMEHFGAVVRGEADPIVSVRDGLQNLRVTEAIAEATKTGHVVELPLV